MFPHGEFTGSVTVRWTLGGETLVLGEDPGGLLGSRALDVWADGSVVVGDTGSARSAGALEAFVWTEELGLQTLGYLGNGRFHSSAKVISEGGRLVLGESGYGEDQRLFAWDEVHGMRDLKHLLEKQHGLAAALDGWHLEEVNDISADGLHVVGTARSPQGVQMPYLIRLDHPLNVPEPAALGLLIVAALASLLSQARGTSRCEAQIPSVRSPSAAASGTHSWNNSGRVPSGWRRTPGEIARRHTFTPKALQN